MAISMHTAFGSDDPSRTVRAIVMPDRSTLTLSSTEHGSTPLVQVTLTSTWRPSTDARSCCGETGCGSSCPGLGITSAGWPAPGATGVGPAGPPIPVPGSPPDPPPAVFPGSMDVGGWAATGGAG